MLRQAAEGGQLYGSVSPRDLAALVSEKGFALNRAQIALNTPIKTIGLHKVPISLHPEVEVTITVTVARNADEAERLARGEDITVAREEAGRAGRGGCSRSLLRAGGGRGAAQARRSAQAGSRAGKKALTRPIPRTARAAGGLGCGSGGAAAGAGGIGARALSPPRAVRRVGGDLGAGRLFGAG